MKPAREETPRPNTLKVFEEESQLAALSNRPPTPHASYCLKMADHGAVSARIPNTRLA